MKPTSIFFCLQSLCYFGLLNFLLTLHPPLERGSQLMWLWHSLS